MRLILLSTFAVCLACNAQGVPRLPPADSFYYPTGITHVAESPSEEGFLYVANANFDRRFDYGSVIALDLSALSPRLPAFGAPVAAGSPMDVRALNLGAQSQVLIQSFAGEMEKRVTSGSARLFIPSRGEGSFIYALDATRGALSCGNDKVAPGAPAGTAADCSTSEPSQSLTVNEQGTATGKPRAPEPYGVGISGDGEVFVTHLRTADSPVGSGTNQETYVVRFPADGPVTDSSYVSLGSGAGSSVAVGARWAYVTGRFLNPRGYVLRLVKRTAPDQAPVVLNPLIEDAFLVSEARGIAINAAEDRAYILARGPDTLFVVDIQGAQTDNPSLNLVHAVPLPAGANEIKLIERSGRGTLAVITCSTANIVVLYDDDIGQLVSLITDVGVQPFGIALAPQSSGGVRIFVSTFGDGRISVLDLPDLAQPQNLRLVARLGRPQVCVTQPTDPACAEPSP